MTPQYAIATISYNRLWALLLGRVAAAIAPTSLPAHPSRLGPYKQPTWCLLPGKRSVRGRVRPDKYPHDQSLWR